MANNTNIGLTIEAWADIVIKEWLKKIEYFGIQENTGQLVRSFKHHVINSANGDPSKVIFAFQYYGKFIDWGVGKYVNIENKDDMRDAELTIRRPRPWYTDVFYKQLVILRHLMETKYASRLEMVVVKNLEDCFDKTQFSGVTGETIQTVSSSKSSKGGARNNYAKQKGRA